MPGLRSLACARARSFHALLAATQAPDDPKNLARVYPGSAGGSLTERTAFTITRDFIAQPDVELVIDLHSAGEPPGRRLDCWTLRLHRSALARACAGLARDCARAGLFFVCAFSQAGWRGW